MWTEGPSWITKEVLPKPEYPTQSHPGPQNHQIIVPTNCTSCAERFVFNTEPAWPWKVWHQTWRWICHHSPKPACQTTSKKRSHLQVQEPLRCWAGWEVEGLTHLHGCSLYVSFISITGLFSSSFSEEKNRPGCVTQAEINTWNQLESNTFWRCFTISLWQKLHVTDGKTFHQQEQR